MKILLQCAVAMAIMAIAAPTHAAPAIALYGDVKYKENFENFDYVNPNAPKGGSFRLSSTAAFDSTNPYIIKGIAAPGISNFVYQSLMTPSYDEPQSYYALIAEDIAVASDGGSVTFRLNPNARWHDGTPITAEDVVWSLDILKEKGHPQYRALYKPITRAIALTTRSVRFEFAEQQRELPIIAASMPVLPRHYFCSDNSHTGGATHSVAPSPLRLRAQKNDVLTSFFLVEGSGRGAADGSQPNPRPPTEIPFSTASATGKSEQGNFDSPARGELSEPAAPLIPDSRSPIPDTCHQFDKTTLEPPLGSGPYRVERIDAGRSITFARDKNYWAANLPSQRGLNNFDTITIDVYRDDVVALQAIKSGAIDFYEEFIARNWATAYNSPAVTEGRLKKINLPHKIPRGMQGFIFNTRRDKFADARVREAIDLTLDFEWMNGTLFYGAYSRNKSFFEATEFESTGLPKDKELALLEKWRCKESSVARRELGEGGEAGSVAPSPLRLDARKNDVNTSFFLDQGSGRGAADRSQPNPRPPTEIPFSTTSATGKTELGNFDSPARGELSEPAAPLPLTASSCLPSSLFTTPYEVSKTDGSGFSRERLIRAQQLLNDAGWVMRDGHRVNATTGEKLTIEFLMTQRTFERVIGIMRHNLSKLGIDSEFRYVDASQYQKRLDKFNFDIVSMWINQGLFYPGSEQTLLWHSSQADVTGGQNLGGVKSPVVDDLVTRLQRAKNLDELRPAARALDRVLLAEHYVIPHWSIHNWRIAYWDKFGRPAITPAYNVAWDSWWMKESSGESRKPGEGSEAGSVVPSPLRGGLGRGASDSAQPNPRPPTEIPLSTASTAEKAEQGNFDSPAGGELSEPAAPPSPNSTGGQK